MDTLKTILDGIFKQQKIEITLKVYRIFDAWGRAVGERIARHSQPQVFREGTLWIVVDSATWMQQLSLLSEDIREKVNTVLGTAAVQKIRFRTGEVRPPADAQNREQSAAPLWADTALDNHTEADIKALVAPISDPQLQERLQHLFEQNSRFLRYQGKK